MHNNNCMGKKYIEYMGIVIECSNRCLCPKFVRHKQTDDQFNLTYDAKLKTNWISENKQDSFNSYTIIIIRIRIWYKNSNDTKQQQTTTNEDVHTNQNGEWSKLYLNDICHVCQQIKQVVIFPVEMLIYEKKMYTWNKCWSYSEQASKQAS